MGKLTGVVDTLTDNLDSIDHDDWTTFEYCMFVYPPEGDQSSEGGASDVDEDDGPKCSFCETAPPAVGERLCSRCDTKLGLWAKSKERSLPESADSAKGAADSADSAKESVEP